MLRFATRVRSAPDHHWLPDWTFEIPSQPMARTVTFSGGDHGARRAWGSFHDSMSSRRWIVTDPVSPRSGTDGWFGIPR